jgi:hypothetical protein
VARGNPYLGGAPKPVNEPTGDLKMMTLIAVATLLATGLVLRAAWKGALQMVAVLSQPAASKGASAGRTA